MSLRGEIEKGILFIDMMSPVGHIRLNWFYMQELIGSDARIYVSDNIIGHYDGFDTQSLGPTLPDSWGRGRLLLARQIVRIMRREAPRILVFFSYDLATFPLISQMAKLLGIRVICFEHNTAPTTRTKALFHRLMAREVTRLVFAPHIQKIYARAGVESKYVPHPCLAPVFETRAHDEWGSIIDSYNGNFSSVAFCPSGTVKLDAIEELAHGNPHTLFVCKSKFNSMRPNVLCHRHFAGYYSALAQCDMVCVPFEPEHKVSGPAFEAIGAGKPLMLLPNTFGHHMKSLFGGSVLFPSDPFPQADTNFPIADYNEEIIGSILQLISLGVAEVRLD